MDAGRTTVPLGPGRGGMAFFCSPPTAPPFAVLSLSLSLGALLKGEGGCDY